MNLIWKDNWTNYAKGWDDAKLAQEIIRVSSEIQDLLEQKKIFETEQATRSDKIVELELSK